MNSAPVVSLVFFSLFQICSALIDCDNVLTDTQEFTGLCNNKWKNLQPLIRPGQPVVGYAWVRRKLDKYFDSKSDAQDYLDETPIVGVINPGIGDFPLITIVDQHHTLCALDYSGYSDVSVTVNIICDYRNLSLPDFYSIMEDQHFLYLAEHPDMNPSSLSVPITANDLPVTFQFKKDIKSFQDDPWRSLSSFSRKVKDAPDGFPSCDDDDSKYCERCYIRLCEDTSDPDPPTIPFYEFRWAYFMNLATFYNSSFWPTFKDWQGFAKAYLELDTDFETLDYDDWQDAADLLIPLCRSTTTGGYTLPFDIFGQLHSQYLPGYVEGPVKLPDDPTCGQPQCK